MANASATAQKQATEAFIASWRKLDIDEIVAGRTTDAIQFQLPESALGMGEVTNEMLVAGIKPMFAALSNFKIDVVSVSHDVEAKRSVIHAKTFADSPVGPYRNEHAMIMTFTEDGTKVKRVDDLMDSQFMTGFQPKLMEYLKKQGSK